MTSYSLAAIADRWRQYGRSRAVHPTLWDSSLVLATLGPQTTSEGTTARDFSGRNNRGTLTGATHLPTWGNWSYRGQAFRALAFDGTEDSVTCGNIGDVTTSFTFGIWAYTTATQGSAYPGIITKTSSDTAQGFGINIYTAADANLNKAYAFVSDGTNSNLAYANSALKDSGWHHLAATIDWGSDLLTLYVDGIQQGSAASIAAVGSIANTKHLRIGAREATASFAYFSGSVSGAFFIGRILTSAAIFILARHPLAAYEVRLPKFFFGTSTAVALTVAGSAVSVTSDSPTLTQHGALTVASSNVVTSSQAPSLTQHNVLSVGSATCAVTAGNVSLIQHHTLTVGNAAIATASEAASLTQHSVLTVGGAACSVTSQSPDLTQHSAMTVGNSVCAVSAGNVALTQHAALSVQSAACSITAENLTLTAHAPAHVALTVAGSKCSVTSGAVSLTQHNVMAVAASACVVSSGNVTLAYHAAGVAVIVEHQTLLLAI